MYEAYIIYLGSPNSPQALEIGDVDSPTSSFDLSEFRSDASHAFVYGIDAVTGEETTYPIKTKSLQDFQTALVVQRESQGGQNRGASSGSGLSGGIVAGAVLLVVAAIVVVLAMYRRRSTRKRLEIQKTMKNWQGDQFVVFTSYKKEEVS